MPATLHPKKEKLNYHLHKVLDSAGILLNSHYFYSI